ncbi:hypothetical protein CBR_g30652 [Chara braunii]|uniref:Uncharacterized protein n=1 Tax=Chara braunii TaxID=69332 RepID=A0A388LDA2_CHABU|nr:hypothetical protein CBR_g30652 [Chara braunii]|eukprot:GBG80285.1 hypothetical protein CBR_g30652 [Chara braunii]
MSVDDGVGVGVVVGGGGLTRGGMEKSAMVQARLKLAGKSMETFVKRAVDDATWPPTEEYSDEVLIPIATGVIAILAVVLKACLSLPIHGKILQTRIEDFFKAVRERFEDKNLARRTEMLILNIVDRKWKSASALKATTDELLQCAEHGLTPTQILNNFARALPDPLCTQLYPRTKEEGMTYEKSSKIAIDHAGFLAEANYCHYSKDLQAGKKWQNCTILGNIPWKDNLLLTFEEGVETFSYDRIDYGLEGAPNGSVVQEGDYKAVAACGGGGQGRGRGRGRGGCERGGRGPDTQRGGGEGSYYVGGRGNGPSQGGRGYNSTWGRGRGTWYGNWDKPYPLHLGLPKGRPWEKLGITEKVWQDRKVADQCLLW